MGNFPLISRPAPVFEFLKQRPTLILPEPIAKMVDGGEPKGCAECASWKKILHPKGFRRFG